MITVSDIEKVLHRLKWKIEKLDEEDSEKLEYLLNHSCQDYVKRYSEQDLYYMVEVYAKIDEYFLSVFNRDINWYLVLKDLTKDGDTFTIINIALRLYHRDIYYNIRNISILNLCKIDIKTVAEYNKELNELIIEKILDRYLSKFDINISIYKDKIIFNNITIKSIYTDLILLFNRKVNFYLEKNKHNTTNIVKVLSKYKDILYWDWISDVAISDDLIDRFKNYLNWKIFTYTIIYYIKKYSTEIILKYKEYIDWKIATVSIYDKYDSDLKYSLIDKFIDYLDWDYLSENIKSKKYLEKYFKYLNTDIVLSNNKNLIIYNKKIYTKDEYITNILKIDKKVFNKRINLGISYKEALTIKSGKFINYNGKMFNILDEDLLYNICKEFDLNYCFYKHQIYKNHMKLFSALKLKPKPIKDGNVDDIILSYDHFIDYNTIDIIKNIVKHNKSESFYTVLDKISKYIKIINFFTSLPKIDKSKTNDVQTSKWNLIFVDISIKKFIDRDKFIKDINNDKDKLLEFILYYISEVDSEIKLMKNYLRPYDWIITDAGILHIQFIVDERLEKIL